MVERLAAVILSAVAALVFGAIAAFVWSSEPASLPAAALFSALSLVSGVMFCRAAFTARRPLSGKESSRLALALVIVGIAGAILGSLVGSATHRLLLLGASLSCVALGLASHSRPGR